MALDPKQIAKWKRTAEELAAEDARLDQKDADSVERNESFDLNAPVACDLASEAVLPLIAEVERLREMVGPRLDGMWQDLVRDRDDRKREVERLRRQEGSLLAAGDLATSLEAIVHDARHHGAMPAHLVTEAERALDAWNAATGQSAR